MPNFEEHQIKALISYYLSNEELKLNIESSEETNKNKISNYECYIIDENWMNKYKELFLYDEISQQIEKVLKQSKDIKKDNNRIDNIYNLIINEFIKKMNEIYKIDNINNEQLCAKLVKDINSFPKETFYETFEITNYENYKSFKFIILDEVTYNLMNKSSEKILQDIKIKEYIINEGRIYIKLEDNILNIYQILIASFINTSNYFIPELLFKYDNNIVLNKDFDYLKKYNYKKFKNEKMSLNGKELIDKTTCKKVGTIHSINNSNFDEQNNNYIKKNIESNFKISNINTTGLNDLMSKNSNNQSKIEKLNEINSNNNTPFSQSKNNQNEINFYERTKDIFEKNKIKKANDMANNTPNKGEMTKIDNINIEINLNNISKDNQNIRLKGRNLSNNNNQIFVERILVPDEDKKNFVSFLIRLYKFNKKLFIKIKNSSKFQIVIEEGYIINNKIVEIINDWFKDAFLMNELHQDNYYITLSKNYQNNHGYISENNIDSFLDLIIKNLPKEYIKKIKDINNSLFLTEFFKKELYTPDIKYYQNNKNYFYFSNCRIINKNLAKCLLYNIKKTNFVELFEKTFINFMIAHNKIFIKFNLHIYIGVIDEKNIFQSEILICCTSENESKHIYNEFKSISMEYFIALTKRVDENNPYIGKYYDTNNIVVILNRKYQINKAAPPKKEKDNLIQMKQILQNQGNNNFYNNRNAQNKINMKKQNDVNKAQNNQQKQFDINNIQVIKNEVKPIIKDNNISRKEIDNLLYIIIELKQLKRKISSKLNKNSTYEIMYPISYDWLNAYLDCYNLKVLNKNKNLYNTIESLINQCQNNTPNERILSMVKNQDDIQKIINNYPCGNPKNYNLLNQIPMIPKKSTINNNINYYKNFILVSQNTLNALSSKYPKDQYFYCYLGENRIFACFNTNLIEVYSLDKDGFITPEIFYLFNGENELKNSLDNLKIQGYENYTKYYLLFIDRNNQIDYASPIFDQNNKEIGYAYKYHPNITDYTPYIVNKEFKSILKLYFHYLRLRTRSNIQDKKYYLINEEYMKKYKEYYEYNNIIKSLYNVPSFKQIISNINNGNNNWDIILSDKNINSIIKNSSLDINKKIYEKSIIGFNKDYIKEEPKIKSVQNSEIFYYDEFEIIDEELYNSLFKSTSEAIYRTCYFVNEFIFIQIPSELNNKSTSCIIIFGSLNQNNIFNAKYLLECNSNNNFKYLIQYANTIGGLDIYLNSIKFNNNIEQLYDGNNNPLGLVYNLSFVPQFNNIVQPKQNIPQLNQVKQPNNININRQMNQALNPITFNNNNNNLNIIQNAPFNQNQQILNPFSSPNPQRPKIIKSITTEFTKPPLIGLKNVGATCYMNATLQCLSQIKQLTDYFKYHDYVNVVISKYKSLPNQKPCLTKSYKNLIENLWPSNPELLDNKNTFQNNNNTYYAPYNFKNKISTMNPLFQGAQANDAKDLVNFIIMTLHEELNKIDKKNIQPILNNNFIINQTNQQEIFKYFLENFMRENKSIISDIFYGATHTITQCTGCPYIKHNFESIFFLIFPLEEVRKFKLQQLMNPNMNQMMMNMNMINANQNMMKIQLLNQNIVDMKDCFDYNRKAERFFGQDAMYCNICKAQMNSTFQTTLYYSPNILILVLNRGKGIQYKVKLKFDEVLDITNYSEESAKTGAIYDLIGVVTHMGESGASGHFVAACKSPKNGVWYKYNDDLVFPVQNFQTEILNYAMPYILFYQKRA